jgi:hypothetical protein
MLTRSFVWKSRQGPSRPKGVGVEAVAAGTEAVEHAGPGRVDDGVAGGDEASPGLDGVRLRQVERDAALVRVPEGVAEAGVEVGAVGGEGAGAAAAGALRRLDLDHVGAGVGEQLARDLAQVTGLDDAQPAEQRHAVRASAPLKPPPPP